MISAALLGVLVVMLLVLTRALKGPTVFDRILAINSFGTTTVIFIAVYGFYTGRPDFLDIALLYALINFIGTIAVTKYVKFANLGHPRRDDGTGDI
jgi:multicomponent Na+:H+ antiporter subunit F